MLSFSGVVQQMRCIGIYRVGLFGVLYEETSEPGDSECFVVVQFFIR